MSYISKEDIKLSSNKEFLYWMEKIVRAVEETDFDISKVKTTMSYITQRGEI